MGKLQEMLDKQNELQSRLGYDITGMGDEERAAFIKEFSIHLNQEVNEMLYELPHFKPWKDYSKMDVFELDQAWLAAQHEFIDALHFFLNISLALGLNEEALHALYMDKNKENHRRQEAGYTHDVKYRQG